MATEQLVVGGWANRSYVQHLWLRYKLKLSEYEALWQAQGGKCAGCEGRFAHPRDKDMILAKRQEVDHDHATGKVRGLLCRGCNDFLGKIKDDKARLLRLEAYLKRNGDW